MSIIKKFFTKKEEQKKEEKKETKIHLDFMVMISDGRIWNVSKIEFKKDYALIYIYVCVNDIITISDQKKIYIDDRKDECFLYQKIEGYWKQINK